MKVIIGSAWPYANGSLHIGRLSALIPADVLARYHRAKGDEVVFVSGSDCHGTPISIRAREEGKSPKEISTFYHSEFKTCFEKLGFSYDLFTKTDTPNHHQGVKKFILELYNKGFIYEKDIEQNYCEHCEQFLPDRYIEGICPHCNGVARGDQCEECSELLDPEDLIDKKCKICGQEPVIKESKHLFFALSKFQEDIKKLVDEDHGWRDNAIKITKRYLREGLRDRAVTRDLEWGVDVPLEGYEGKKIYVWIEAVMAYLTASLKCIEERGQDFKEYWNTDESRVYFTHGKDNIPFHTVIFPALLFGLGIDKCNIRIISSEHLNLEGKKFSTSRNWAVWVPYIIENYNADSIRYFLIANGAEKRDSDFSWREFINTHNGELLGGFGNFINRSLSFIHKYLDGELKNCELNLAWKRDLTKLYVNFGDNIEKGNFKEGIQEVFSMVKKANKFFDDKKPWITLKEDRKECENTLYTCVQIIANLSNILEPIMPFACEKIRGFLNIEKPTWKFIELKEVRLNKIDILFERIDKKKILEEVQRLKEKRI
ncbi:methionyl-tRNA synthetase [Clostridium cavendishii DSM 21758]|uniref:Methionine--tRNA ligase n=1 Tax=Clostridium cavendishii DSM 21758 TaxID=1121302 RepID=A0A1M6PE07_9CLOT|nr:methionine--tRNA ligase [Clostridium cavendishii]SHK06198.1 methionyl-tRNA synthetase [Clostridium cavendishii DSM 21758]